MKDKSKKFWSSLRWKLYLPEYFYRPRQIYRRIMRRKAGISGYQIARLPWGADIRVRLPGLIQNSIWFKGCYDIVTAETIWRLLDTGETALDVGANFGYFTSLMAIRSGNKGNVIAFEPHPTMFEELEANIGLFEAAKGFARIETRRTALSSQSGVGTLIMPESWEGNRGAAFVSSQSTDSGSNETLEIVLERLDNAIPGESEIGVAKFDIEGHEFDAFKGAESLLKHRKIRDIVFEDQRGETSPAKNLLKQNGYTLFSLAKRFRGPRLCDIDGSGTSPRDDPNFLASLDPERAIARMKPRGWAAIREG